MVAKDAAARHAGSRPGSWSGSGPGPAQSIDRTPEKRTPMTIEISKEARQLAITSIQRYFQENMEEPIGNIGAGALLGFFLEEVGPLVYNKAVAEVQERLQQRISEIDLEVHEDEFQYWRKFDKQKKGR
jgi:uncharacterized protein (DUF2164 family)